MTGSKQSHSCLNIEGAIRNKAFSIFSDDNGNPISAAEGEKYLRAELAKGHRVIPMGKCDNFDYQKGCQGHSEKAPLIPEPSRPLPPTETIGSHQL